MRPLLDADVLLYEVGYSSQTRDAGFWVPRSWDWCQELFDKKVALICDEVRATEAPTLFLTNTPYISNLLNRKRKWEGEESIVEYIPNFRESLSTTGYKQGRKEEKPIHFKNLVAYMFSEYDVHVSENGLEADDALCIRQMSADPFGSTVICSRDKDLRQCSGWHYSWECGKQNAIGPVFVEQPGWIELQLKVNEKGKRLPPKLFGYGHKFFYAQLLMGDCVDTIKGAKGLGAVKAFAILEPLRTEEEMLEAVTKIYKDIYKEEAEKVFREQADLLWMIRKMKDGEPVRWRM